MTDATVRKVLTEAAQVGYFDGVTDYLTFCERVTNLFGGLHLVDPGTLVTFYYLGMFKK